MNSVLRCRCMETAQHLYHRPCTHCDKPVPTTIPRGPIFCSTQCYRANSKKSIRPKDVVFRYEKQCEQCGNRFGTNYQSKKTCSRECSKLRHLKLVKIRINSTSRQVRFCGCGSPLKPRKRFCCKGCAAKYGCPTDYARVYDSVRSLGSELCRLSQDEYDAIQDGFDREMGLEFQVGAMFEEVKNLRGTVHWENRMLHHIGEMGRAPRGAINQRRKYS